MPEKLVQDMAQQVREMTSSTQFTLFSTQIGACGIAWRGGVVVATCLPDERAETTARHLATRRSAEKGEPPATIQQAITAMTALLEGEQTDLTFIVCDMRQVEPFAGDVYRATRAIPVGQTTTYGAIAEQLGNKQLSRQVGQALGRNPLPIIVPCHRVLGANGKLTGFSATGGTATKLKMLEIEGAQIGEGTGLFDNLPLAVKRY